MDITGIGSIADLSGNVINKIWPDKSEQEKAEIANAFALMQGQMDANKIEASNPNLFVSGWRPGIGWVCTLALFYQFLLKPLGCGIAAAFGHPLPTLPGIDNNLWELMFGMLGMGTLRSFDKIKKVDTK